MRHLLLGLLLAFGACVDRTAAEREFCNARPELCDSDAGSDAGPVCPTNEEFAGASWTSCSTLFAPPSTAEPARLENGSLVFDQLGGNSWSFGTTGSLLSQEVTGNFVAEVRARLVVPQPDGGRFGRYTAAVLVAVDPARPQLNNRLVSVGALDSTGDGGLAFGVLSEQTADGGSAYVFEPSGDTEAYLRLCRVDGGFIAIRRPLDGGPARGFAPFTDAGTLTLPETVRLGPAAYNLEGPTARIEHDSFRISSAVTSQLDCYTVTLR